MILPLLGRGLGLEVGVEREVALKYVHEAVVGLDLGQGGDVLEDEPVYWPGDDVRRLETGAVATAPAASASRTVGQKDW